MIIVWFRDYVHDPKYKATPGTPNAHTKKHFTTEQGYAIEKDSGEVRISYDSQTVTLPFSMCKGYYEETDGPKASPKGTRRGRPKSRAHNKT